jgi:hypothetical protein
MSCELDHRVKVGLSPRGAFVVKSQTKYDGFMNGKFFRIVSCFDGGMRLFYRAVQSFSPVHFSIQPGVTQAIPGPNRTIEWVGNKGHYLF